MTTFWQNISKFILKNRLFLLLVLILSTGYMGFRAKDTQMSYQFAKAVPPDNPQLLEFERFKDQFGSDGNILVLGVQTDKVFNVDFYNDWYQLGNDIDSLHGIDDVVSIAHTFNLVKNKEEKKFEIVPFVDRKLKDQAEADSLKEAFLNLPFYQYLIFNPDSNSSVMAVTINKKINDSKDRLPTVGNIYELVEEFQEKHNVEIKLSGLPVFRYHSVTKIAKELQVFLLLALLVTALILYLLFRSFYPVIFSMTVVVIGVIWSLGIINVLGYKITILTGLVPALIVVIGIPNCVYLLNKYHAEFKKHGNKMKALSRVIEKIGHVSLFTNLTTATGFGVFYFTDIKILEQFGAIAGLNIAMLFFISIIFIPVIFSYLPEPKTKHTGYLDFKWLNFILDKLDLWAHHYRTYVYTGAGILIVIALIGVSKLQATGFMLDDIPKKSKIYNDLKFFERNFKGILPFEILIDTKSKRKATQLSTMQKIEEVQEIIGEFPELSKPISVVEGIKFATQAFYNGNPARYRLPDNYDKNFILAYLSKIDENNNLLGSFVDSNRQITRISLDVADIGSAKMPLLIDSLSKRIDEVLPPDKYDVSYTGVSIVSLAGYNYLINSLVSSVSLAFLLIALIMAYLFRSFRMLLISLLPNTIPLLFTAAIMGYFDIPLKPSTVLIFSIAFGISVDDTIHYLAKYRQELYVHRWDISKTVSVSLKETGISMIYTTLILFCGFIVFTASEFEGTKNLGLLTSIALIVAVLTNLLLLPSLLLTFERLVDRRALKKEPLIDVFDEEEDIELEKLDFPK